MGFDYTVAGFIFVVTIVTSLIDLFAGAPFQQKFILNPYLVVQRKQYHRVITSTLIHANVFHLAVNMITYYFFAFWLENVMGQVNFAIVYLGSTLGSTLPSVIKHKNNPNYNALGASGAIAGILFSFILFYPTAMLGVLLIIPMPAWIFAIIYLIYSWYSSKNSQDNIAHDAHLWGALAGLVITIILRPDVIYRVADIWYSIRYWLS